MKKGAGGRRTPERKQGKSPGKSGVNKGIKVNMPTVQRQLEPQNLRTPTSRQKL